MTRYFIFVLALILFASVAFAQSVKEFEGTVEVLTVNFDPSHPCDNGWDKVIGTVPQYPGGEWEVLAGYSAEESSIKGGCSAEKQLGYALSIRAPKGIQTLKDAGWPAQAIREPRAVSGLGAVMELRLVKEPEKGDPGRDATPPEPGQWLGKFSSPPDTTRLGDTYSHDNGAVYVWTGPSSSQGWKLQTPPPEKGEKGESGETGTSGTAGAWAFESFSIAAGPTFLCPDSTIEDHWHLAVMSEFSFEIHISEKILGAMIGRVGGPSEWVGYGYKAFDPSFGVAAEIRYMPKNWVWMGLGGGYDAYGVYKWNSDGEWYASVDNAGGRASLGFIPWAKKSSSLTLSLNAQGGLGSNPARFAAQAGWRWGSPDDSK